MSIRDLRLDESVWESGNPMRRAEWRAAIDDLLSYARVGGDYDERYVLLTPHGASSESARVGFMLEFLDDDGNVRAVERIEHELLEPHVREYLAIIRRLDEGAGHREPAWVEAVDMAKKVVHDTAAKSLASALPALSDDHETFRRLFTLFLSLLVDTTKLTYARGHRRAGM